MGFFGAISNFLNGPVGNNLANEPQDVRNTKKNLSNLGYFDDETENDFITRALDTGIKGFQRDNGLRIDGKLLPGGETEREIEAQTLPAPEPYHPISNPGGKRSIPPRKLIHMEDSSRFNAQLLSANSEEDINRSSEDNSEGEDKKDTVEDAGDPNDDQENAQDTLPTINHE